MGDSPLTHLQRLALELFFALPESDGFAFAGGAALVATGLTDRPAQDIDLRPCRRLAPAWVTNLHRIRSDLPS